MSVTWDQAAQQVSDRWIAAGRMTLPPDAPTDDDELAFWDEVESLVNGDKAKAFDPHEARDEHGRWTDGPGISIDAVKVGQRLQFSGGTDHSTGQPVGEFRGTVARKASDGRMIVNAGTPKKPHWVQTHVDHASEPVRKQGSRNENKRNYASSITEDERKALLFYQGEGYRTINKALRSNKEPSALSKRRIEALDSAISKGTADSDMTLYRGFNGDPAKLVMGATFTDKGYASTSESSTIPARMAAARRDGVYARIHVRAGQHLAYVHKVHDQQATSKYGGDLEREVLLPRDSTYTVTRVQRAADGGYIVDMELS